MGKYPQFLRFSSWLMNISSGEYYALWLVIFDWMPFCEIRNVLSCGVNYIIFKLLQYILPYFIIVRLSVYSNYVYIPTTVYIKCILSQSSRNVPIYGVGGMVSVNLPHSCLYYDRLSSDASGILSRSRTSTITSWMVIIARKYPDQREMFPIMW